MVVEGAVVAVAVLWHVVVAAVLWHVVAVVPSVASVLISLLWAAAVQSDLVVLVVYMCFLESRSSAPSLIIMSRISFSASDAIPASNFAHLFAVALCGTYRLLPFTRMTLAGPIKKTLRLRDSLTRSPIKHCISKNVVTLHGS